MPRLFFGNFDFEHHLADKGFQPSAKLIRLNAELATSWLAVAEDGDYVWCPQFVQLLEQTFKELTIRHGLPRVIPIMDLKSVPAGVEFIPWGWTDPVIQKARLHGWDFRAPHSNVIREANSRAFSFDLECEWQIGLPEACAVRDAKDFKAAVFRAADISDRCVIKANWGMSGRERRIIHGKPTLDDHHWAQRRLRNQPAVFVEPWVQRLEEIGIQIQIPPVGTPHVIDVTQLVCDAKGQYLGSWFTEPLNAGADFRSRWQPAVDIAMRAAARLQDRGYFGPLGIDAMRYRMPDGSIHLRSLQDINARWTMGRLSLGWRKLLREGECACWWHGSTEQSEAITFHELLQQQRSIDLAPPWENDESVQHTSRLIFLSTTPHD